MGLFFRPGEAERVDRALTLLPCSDDFGLRWNRLAPIGLPEVQSPRSFALLCKCESRGEAESTYDSKSDHDHAMQFSDLPG
jgi:hypothetical protein